MCYVVFGMFEYFISKRCESPSARLRLRIRNEKREKKREEKEREEREETRKERRQQTHTFPSTSPMARQSNVNGLAFTFARDSTWRNRKRKHNKS